MKSKLQMKTNKNERGIWGFEFDLTEMHFPSPGLGHKYEVKVILRQHYHIILAVSLEKIYPCILGEVVTVSLII